MAELKSEFLFDAHFDLEPPQVLSGTPNGMRQILLVKGGTVKGPKVSGVSMPGGGDWLRVRPDGIFELDVRACWKMDDDQLVYVTQPGVVDVSQAVFGRILQGEDVDLGEYYFRTIPRFETGSEKYGWLNNIISVGVGKAGPGLRWVEYAFYRIL